jgi:hypothetical protein
MKNRRTAGLQQQQNKGTLPARRATDAVAQAIIIASHAEKKDTEP